MSRRYRGGFITANPPAATIPPNNYGMVSPSQQFQIQGAGTWPAFPGAPTSVSASAGNQSADVSFTAPTNAGYPSTITTYLATSTPGNFTGTASSSPITVSGLTNGTSYTFTVAAQNASGYGAQSSPSGSVTPVALYVEDMFAPVPYLGNPDAGDVVVNNGINLVANTGLVWIKDRTGAWGHYLFDTTNGVNNYLSSNTTSGITNSTTLTAFNTNGFRVTFAVGVNRFGSYMSWTFKKSTKFFDVVTWTGNGANRNIAHSLGVAPGCILVKRTDTTSDWQVYHRSISNTEYMVLNTTAAMATGTNRWNSTTATATQFSVGTDASVNASGGTYTAYLFAHDASASGMIQCGSFNAVSGVPTEVTLGWEPQWVLFKSSATADIGWELIDNMRGWSNDTTTNGYTVPFEANTTATEGTTDFGWPTATGFVVNNLGNLNCVYIAIRRGPMKIPTVGTSVFAMQARGGNTGTATQVAASTARADLGWVKFYGGSLSLRSPFWVDRLRGPSTLSTNSTNGEAGTASDDNWPGVNILDVQYGFKVGNSTLGGNQFNTNNSSNSYINYSITRAPSFFDEVCYKGTGANTTFSHNLTVAPQLMFIKKRTSGTDWLVYASGIANTEYLTLNSDAGKGTDATVWNSTAPTSTVFTVGTNASVNASGAYYTAYLFTSCAGVSKVGSYTGNGSSQTINCSFTGGSRFVLIKRANATGGWTYFDTARGMAVGNDPYLFMNDTVPQNQYGATDAVATQSTGFTVTQEGTLNLNVNGATYIYLAIA